MGAGLVWRRVYRLGALLANRGGAPLPCRPTCLRYRACKLLHLRMSLYADGRQHAPPPLARIGDALSPVKGGSGLRRLPLPPAGRCVLRGSAAVTSPARGARIYNWLGKDLDSKGDDATTAAPASHEQSSLPRQHPPLAHPEPQMSPRLPQIRSSRSSLQAHQPPLPAGLPQIPGLQSLLSV